MPYKLSQLGSRFVKEGFVRGRDYVPDRQPLTPDDGVDIQRWRDETADYFNVGDDEVTQDMMDQYNDYTADLKRHMQATYQDDYEARQQERMRFPDSPLDSPDAWLDDMESRLDRHDR